MEMYCQNKIVLRRHAMKTHDTFMYISLKLIYTDKCMSNFLLYILNPIFFLCMLIVYLLILRNIFINANSE